VGTGRSPFLEQGYHADLCQNSGQPIVPARIALGALLIKERQGLTDRETVETIVENPYMQFFLGKEEFTQEPPFDASLMVDFRKRFGEEGMQKENLGKPNGDSVWAGS